LSIFDIACNKQPNAFKLSDEEFPLFVVNECARTQQEDKRTNSKQALFHASSSSAIHHHTKFHLMRTLPINNKT